MAIGLQFSNEFEAYCTLLGRPRSDPSVRELVSSLDPDAKAQIFDDYLGCFEFPKHGIAIMLKKGEWLSTEEQDATQFLIEAIHFYSGGYEAFAQYQRNLIDGVNFFDNQAEVRSKLGEPTSTGGGNPNPFNRDKPWPFWDHYDLGKCSVGLTYSVNEKRLVLITLFLQRR